MKEKTITPFNRRIYELVRQIPKGKVLSYGQLAAAAGSPRACRAVGSAMRFAPEYLDLPCHRVVNKAGEMAPDFAFGGAEEQRTRLEEEGVLFRTDGTVDMDLSRWEIE